MNTINWTITMTPSGGGSAFGMPASGRALAVACSVAGAPMRERNVDAFHNDITTQHPGTQVWSPPT